MALGFTRREALCGGCAFGVIACSDGGTGNPLPPGGTTSPTTPEDTGTPTIPDGLPCEGAVVQAGAPGWVGFTFADFPDLATVGGWYGVTAGGKTLVLACVAPDCYVAIERHCAHEGELINYIPTRGEHGQFVCPRHGAVYDLEGNKVSGPQPTGLPTYTAGLDGDTVWVDAS